MQDEIKQRIISMKKGGAPSTEISALFNIHRATVDRVIRAAREIDRGFVLSDIPSSDRSIEEILDARRQKYRRVSAHYKAKKIQSVSVKLHGPIGIAHFGDPHLDDNGCDLDLFESHMKVVRDTEGLFAGNVGDITNNWVGRLTTKYEEQTTTKSEAWKLCEWIFQYMPWLYVISGNHDNWSGSSDPLSFITKSLDQPYIPNGIRLNLKFPKGTDCIVHAAYDPL